MEIRDYSISEYQLHISNKTKTYWKNGKPLCKRQNIKRVIVFGSSTMARCNLWSDIDIYFEFDKEPFRYPCIKDPNEVFDKFNNFSLSQEFKDMIYEEGVIVYEREPSLSILIGKRENCKKE